MSGSRRVRRRAVASAAAAAAAALSLALTSRANAALAYWDSNGTTAGAGATPNGTWGSSTFWTTNADGTSSTGGWTASDTAVFSAGSDASGPFTVTISSLQLATGITFEEGAVTLNGNPVSLSLPGGISLGGASVSVNGTASLIVGGNITYDGNSAPASISNDLTLPSGVHTIGLGTGSSTGPAYDLVIGGTLSGSGKVNFGGLFSSVALTHANSTYTGGTVVDGFLTVAAPNALPSQGEVVLNGFLSLSAVAQSGVTPGDYGQSIGSLSGAGTIALGSATLTVGNNNTSTTFSGNLNSTGGGALVKVGTGTLTLSGAGNYNGGTTVKAGTLRLGANSAVGAGNTLNVAAGTFDLNGFNPSISNLTFGDGAATAAATVSGAGTLSVGGNVAFQGAPGAATPPATLSADVTLGSGAHTISNPGNVISSGVAYDLILSGIMGGTGGLTEVGTGAFAAVLTRPNTYAGATTISAGTLYLAATNALPSQTTLAISASGALVLNPTTAQPGVTPGSYSQSVASLSGAGSISLGSATLTVGSNNASTTFSGPISGSLGGLVKLGTGTLTLSASNSYGGNTTVKAGTLRMGANQAGGSGALLVDAGVFDVNGFLQATTFVRLGDGSSAAAANITGTGFLIAGGDIAFSGGFGNVTPTATISPRITLTSGTHAFRKLTSSHSSGTYDLVFDGIIDGSGGISVDTNCLFNQQNTYGGPTSFFGGALSLGTTNALPVLTAVMGGGSLRLNGFNQSIGSLGGSPDVNLGSATLTVGNDNTSTTYGGIMSSSPGAALVKVGTGTLTLAGTLLSYDGSITVTGGKLVLGLSRLTPAPVSVGSGGTLELAQVSFGPLMLRSSSLSIASGGKINLQNNRLITTNAIGTLSTGNTYSGVTGLIQSGRNGGGWSGSGIVTGQTDATIGSLTSIGVATASQVKGIAGTATAVWSSQTVTGSNTLVMYTYGGDANLDGKINIDDYGHIDTSVGVGKTGWFNGDFNYDGKINIDDYGIIDVNVGIQGTSFSTGPSDPMPNLAAVPEPRLLPCLLPLFTALAYTRRNDRRRRRERLLCQPDPQRRPSRSRQRDELCVYYGRADIVFSPTAKISDLLHLARTC